MCRPRFCEVQENDAVEVQQFQRASKQVNEQIDRRSRYRQQKRRDNVQASREKCLDDVQHVEEKIPTQQLEHDIPISPMQRVVASGVGTVAMSLFMTPLDVVKVRMQAQQHLKLAGQSITSAIDSSHTSLMSYNSQPKLVQLYRGYHTAQQLPTRFTGTLDGFVKIARHEGLPRLWSGLPPTLLMRIPSNVIYFTAYENVRSLLGYNPSRNKDGRNTMATSAASGTARGISITAVSPMELVRTRMQAQAISYSELGRFLQEAIKHEGWSSLWKGLGPQILRDVPYAIIYWTNYEMLKTQLSQSFNTGEPSVAITFVAGAISGVFASVVTTPFDVVKTEKQLSVGHPGRGIAVKVVHRSTWTVMKQLYGEAGARALFVGLVPRVIKAAPASAILVTVYEFTMRVFEHYNAQQARYVYAT